MMIKIAQEAGVKIMISRSSASLFAVLQSQGLQINVLRGAFGSPNKFELSVDDAEVTIQLTGTFSAPALSVDETTVTIA